MTRKQIESLIAKYSITLVAPDKISCRVKSAREGQEKITPYKAEIVAVLAETYERDSAEQAARAKAEADKQAARAALMAQNVPGLDELREAMSALERWHDDQNYAIHNADHAARAARS